MSAAITATVRGSSTSVAGARQNGDVMLATTPEADRLLAQIKDEMTGLWVFCPVCIAVRAVGLT